LITCQIATTLSGMQTPSSTIPVSFRIRMDLASKIRPLAQGRGISESRLIEELIAEALRGTTLSQIDLDDPNMALDALLEEVKRLLEPRRQWDSLRNRSAILDVFIEIDRSPALLKLHDVAVMPPAGSGLTCDARNLYVHQRIGRFVKTFLGMRSVKEVTLPRGSETLIRSYTQLA
jgi:hypothetical protein